MAAQARVGRISTPLMSLLPQLRYPLILAPMAFRSGSALSLAVSRAGGLGLLGVGRGLDLPWVREQVNVLSQAAASSATPLAWGAGFMNFALDRSTAALDIVLAARPTAVLFAFGPGEKYAAQARAAGTPVILSQVQTVEMAIDAARYSDVLVLQGSEAGGHGASDFTRCELFAGVKRAQSAGRLSSTIPIVLAGGYGSPVSIAAGMAQPGVSGLLCGTRFLGCTETDGTAAAKQLAIASSGSETYRGTVFDYLANPNVWPAPFDGRAVLYPQALEWLGRESELSDPAVTEAESARFKSTGPNPGVTVWAGTGLDAVEREEPAGEVVRIIGEAMEAGWARRT